MLVANAADERAARELRGHRWRTVDAQRNRVDAGRAQVEKCLRQLRRIRNPDQAAACGPGNLIENFRAGLARPEQQSLYRRALPMRVNRGGMRCPPVRLAVGEEHDHARGIRAPVGPQFLQRRRDTGRKVRAAGSWHVAQCLRNQFAVRRHWLHELAAAVEADYADLDVASG
jgi:hypothetical protein